MQSSENQPRINRVSMLKFKWRVLKLEYKLHAAGIASIVLCILVLQKDIMLANVLMGAHVFFFASSAITWIIPAARKLFTGNQWKIIVGGVNALNLFIAGVLAKEEIARALFVQLKDVPNTTFIAIASVYIPALFLLTTCIVLIASLILCVLHLACLLKLFLKEPILQALGPVLVLFNKLNKTPPVTLKKKLFFSSDEKKLFQTGFRFWALICCALGITFSMEIYSSKMPFAKIIKYSAYWCDATPAIAIPELSESNIIAERVIRHENGFVSVFKKNYNGDIDVVKMKPSDDKDLKKFTPFIK